MPTSAAEQLNALDLPARIRLAPACGVGCPPLASVPSGGIRVTFLPCPELGSVVGGVRPSKDDCVTFLLRIPLAFPESAPIVTLEHPEPERVVSWWKQAVIAARARTGARATTARMRLAGAALRMRAAAVVDEMLSI